MANLFVVIELVDEKPHPGSLEVLGQARRVGSTLGATVYAIAACASPPGYGDDGLIAMLSRHGADKVLLAISPAHAGPMRWGSHGAALLLACATMQPLLLLVAETGPARDVAGRLAARLGAAFLGDAWIELDGAQLVLFDGAGDRARRLDEEPDYTVVATIPPGRYPPALGDEEAEIEMLEAPGFPGPDFEGLAEPVDAPLAVVCGRGDPAERLAHALHGTVCGPAPPPVALAVSLDGSFDGARAEVQVALGPDASRCAGARYAVDGDAAELAEALARAVGGDRLGK